MTVDERLNECISKVLLLSVFKSFCEKFKSIESQKRLRNIYRNTPDCIETTRNIITNDLHESCSTEEAKTLNIWIQAFLSKKSFRQTIPVEVKTDLLKKQKFKCAICGCAVDEHSHVDHVIPFKYVGDELQNNYQMLCTTCNTKKNDSIDYQMRFLLRTI